MKMDIIVKKKTTAVDDVTRMSVCVSMCVFFLPLPQRYFIFH